jgi:probable HAF family extracellular repeat protein
MEKENVIILLAVVSILFVGCSSKEEPAKADADPVYEIVEIPVTGVNAINNNGMVAGYNTDASGRTLGCVWDVKNGTVTLPTLGGPKSYPWAINDKGQVVGMSHTADEPIKDHAFFWDPADKDRMIDMGTFGGDVSEAKAINNNSVAAGLADTAEGVKHAFIWSKDKGLTDLGVHHGVSSAATDINDASQVCGTITMDTGRDHPFYWDAETGMVDIIGKDSMMGTAVSIDAKGCVFGSAYVKEEKTTKAFIWEKDKGITYLNVSPNESRATAMNDNGWIIGSLKIKEPKQRYNYLARPPHNKAISLNTFTAEGDSIDPVDINNSGWIIGTLNNKPILLKIK